MQLGDLTLNIVVNITDASGKVKSFTSDLKQTESQLNKTGVTSVTLHDKLQNLALRFQGVQSVLSILKGTFGQLIQEYYKQEVALAKLENGLKNVGEGASALHRLTSQAGQLQQITPFSDEDINNAQATLTTFQKSSDEIGILIPRVLDLAAARMQDGDAQANLSDIARVLGKVNEENIAVLKRYGIVISDNDKEMLKSLKGTEQAEYLAGLLEKRVGGMAETIGNTAAGKMKIFQNAIGELKETLGKIISEVLIPLLSPLKVFADWLTTQPSNVKVAAVAIIALGTAFIFLNGQTNIYVKVFSLIGALIIALPPGLRAAVGGVLLLAAAFFAMNIQITVMNVSLGGLPIVLGLLITGIIAVASGIAGVFGDTKKATEEYRTSIEDLHTAIQTHEADIANLKQMQQELASANTLTKDEQAALNDKLREAAAIHPTLIAGINEQTGALETTSQAIQEVIDKEMYLNQLRRDVAINDQVKMVQDLIEEHGNEIEQQSELERSIENLRAARENYLKVEGEDISRIGPNMITTYEKKADAIKRVENEIQRLSEKMLDSDGSAKKLESALAEAIKQGAKFGDLKSVVEKLKIAIGNNEAAANAFFRAVSSQIGGQISDWNSLITAVHNYQNAVNSSLNYGPPPPPTQNREYFQKQIDDLKKQRDALDHTKKKEIADYNKQITELEKKNSAYEPKTSTGTRRSSTKEKDNSEEIAKDQERLNLEIQRKKDELIENEYLKKKALIYDTYNEELVRIRDIQNATVEQKDALNKIAADKRNAELKELQIEREKESEEQFQRSLKFFDDLFNEQKKIDKNIRDNRIALMEDEYEMRKAKIKALYNDEIERIKNLKDATDDQKRILKGQAELKKDKELDIVKGEEQLQYFYKAKSVAEQIQGIFNFGSNTVFFNFVRALQITEQIINLFKTIDAISGVISFLGKIFGFVFGGPAGAIAGGAAGGGFATGGIVPGEGSGDTVPAWLTPGEFVIRKSRVQELGTNFLQWLNGGSLMSRIAGHYNTGGMVAAAVARNNANVKVDMPDIKIKGSDIYLSWQRTNSAENKRTK